jgi:hypothetical protein
MTFRDKTIYLHVFRWTGDTLRLPPLKAKVLRVVALTGGEAKCEQTPRGLIVTLPEAQRDKTDSIIKLEVGAPVAGEFVNGKPLEIPEPVALRLDSPLDYQVFQRRTRTEGIVSVSGRTPEGTDKVEVQLGGDWLPVEFSKQDGTFRIEVKVSPGGWLVCRARATEKGKPLAAAEVPHVGVGEVFVVAGQSNSANHGAEKQKTKTGLVAAFDGKRWRPANDPQPGASGGSGSFMPPLGDAIAEKFHVPVGIVACGVGATSVREWLPKGAKFPNPPTIVGLVTQLPGGGWESKGAIFPGFTARMKQLGSHGFRAVLWHQGESDANQQDPTRTLPGKLYRQYLERLIRDSRREIGWDAPWFVAQVSYHTPDDPGSDDIRAAQKSLWDAGIALEGPDTDKLTGNLRDSNGKGVHLSASGLREHAARWVEKVAPWLDKQLATSAESSPGQ